MEMQRSSAAANIRRYVPAALVAITALILRDLLTPVLGEQNPYHTAWVAVAFSAWYCGLGPAVLTVLLDLAGIWYWLLPPAGSLRLAHPKTDMFGLLGFAVFSACIIAMGEAHRRALTNSKRAEEQLRNTYAGLEQKVQDRTAELVAANENLRELSGRLQQLRDEERRQIARELHDSVGQLLAALSMNIATVRSESHKLNPPTARAVEENAGIVEQISKEIRTISHLLHPPLLDAAGLASAIRWYVDGFSERSRIKVDVDIPSEFSRLSDAMEIAIFRLVQECLTNIHRHSGSNTATIAICQADHTVVVEIKDAGKGIPLGKQLELSSGRTGVGFRGMRERLRQFGGDLDVQSDGRGTWVKARLPLQPPSGSAPSNSAADLEEAS